MQRIKKTFFLVVAGIFSLSIFTLAGFPEGKPIVDGLQSATADTLNKNEWIVGIGPVAYGVTEELQIGTNIFLFFLGPNFTAKYNLDNLIQSDMKIAAGVGYWKIDIGDLADVGAFTVFLPVTKKLNEKWNLTVIGQYASIDVDIGDEDVGSVSGTSISAGFDGNIGEITKFLAEAGYDIDFKSLRLGGGILFGWEKFRLKLGLTIAPATYPIIGLWWRFSG